MTLLQRGYCTDRATRDECEDWKNWFTERFCTDLLKAVPDESIDTPLEQASFLEQVSSFNVRFDLNKIETDTQNDTALANLVANFPSTTAEEQLHQLPTHPVNWQLILRRKVNGETVPINDLKDFRIVWWTQLTTLRNSANELRAAGFDVTPGPSKPVTKQKSLKKTSKLSSTIRLTDVVIPSSILGAPTNLSSADFLTATVSYVSQPNQPRNEVQVLIDTGSFAGNFVAMRVIKNFHLEEFIIFVKTLTVCSALDGKCYNISKSINLKMTYFSERLKKCFFKFQSYYFRQVFSRCSNRTSHNSGTKYIPRIT